MVALDTNVLLRFLLNDDARQSAEAERLIRKFAALGEVISISTVVLAEVMWVVKSQLRLPRDARRDFLEPLLLDPRFRFEHQGQAIAALESWVSGGADYSDYLIGELAGAAGAAQTLTFDKALKGAPGFKVQA
jgi:predicted nucleic-acid-binding protein